MIAAICTVAVAALGLVCTIGLFAATVEQFVRGSFLAGALALAGFCVWLAIALTFIVKHIERRAAERGDGDRVS